MTLPTPSQLEISNRLYWFPVLQPPGDDTFTFPQSAFGCDDGFENGTAGSSAPLVDKGPGDRVNNVVYSDGSTFSTGDGIWAAGVTSTGVTVGNDQVGVYSTAFARSGSQSLLTGGPVYMVRGSVGSSTQWYSAAVSSGEKVAAEAYSYLSGSTGFHNLTVRLLSSSGIEVPGFAVQVSLMAADTWDRVGTTYTSTGDGYVLVWSGGTTGRYVDDFCVRIT